MAGRLQSGGAKGGATRSTKRHPIPQTPTMIAPFVGSSVVGNVGQFQPAAEIGTSSLIGINLANQSGQISVGMLPNISGHTTLANNSGFLGTPFGVSPQDMRSSDVLNIESVTLVGDANYAILTTDRVINGETNFTATRTWTLPAISSVNQGTVIRIISVPCTSTNNFILTTTGSDLIFNIKTGASAITWTFKGPTSCDLVVVTNSGGSFWCMNLTGLALNTVSGPSPLLGFQGLDIESNTPVGDQNYAMLPSDRCIQGFTAFTATRTWTLPLSTNCNPGARLIVQFNGNTPTNQLTISKNASDTWIWNSGANQFPTSLTFNGAATIEFINLGANGWVYWEPQATGQFIGRVSYSGSGSLVAPIRSSFGVAHLWGGSGGSGGITAVNCATGGGGGGSYIIYNIPSFTALQNGNTLNYTVGGAGAAGTNTGGNGGNGGATTLSSGGITISTQTANGGNGSLGNTTATTTTIGGTGGTATGGTYNISGGNGDPVRALGATQESSLKGGMAGGGMGSGGDGVSGTGSALAGNAGTAGGLFIDWYQ